MALTYTYPDAYLSAFCTEDREARALAEVELLATSASVTFDADWTERLVILQTYVIACLENQADSEDLFTAKLKAYREQMNAQLPRAIQAAKAAAGTISNIGLLSIPLERS